MCNKPEQLQHIKKAFLEPVRSLLDFLASLEFCTVHPIKDKYDQDVQSKKAAEAIE
jgi:hypothetical protein